MDLMNELREKAKRAPMRVAFSEADDPTMMRAIGVLAREGIATCIAVGDAAALRGVAAECGVDEASIRIVDAADEALYPDLVERFSALEQCRYSEKAIRRRLSRPLERALIMQAVGDADITFAGISTSTGDVLLAAQSIIGLAEGIDTPSSVGIFDIPGWQGSEGSLLAFGDSAVCQNPGPAELASIAISACDTVSALTGWEPRCALLSFSTCGSGSGEMVEKVQEACRIARERRGELLIDGEFQLDSAISERTASRKVTRESAVAGRANIIIWPDLDAGNIGVKLVQQFAHAQAYGPMLQGFRSIVCDCSRSAGVEEIVGNVVMSCVRAQALQSRSGAIAGDAKGGE